MIFFILLALTIDSALINAVIRAESAWKPNAMSSKGAAGLLQLREIAWQDVQQNYPDLKRYEYNTWKFDPVINKRFGTAYLNLLNNRLGENASLENVLGSYNWGRKNVRGVEYDLERFPTETKNYITKIKGFLGK